MKTVNAVSGGRTSAYIAAHYPADYDIFSLVCIDDTECKPKDASIIQYANDKLGDFYIKEFGEFIATAEDDRTLVALRDLEQMVGREITWIRGRSFDQIIDEGGVFGGQKTMLPNKHFRYCTLEMKMYPMFQWWMMTQGDQIKKRIGFRFDEYERMERFVNSQQLGTMKIPVSCSTRGQRKQKLESFRWEHLSFPLIKDGITEGVVKEYWRNKYVRNDLFETRKIEFPEISNCVHCFWKKLETLSIMANIHTEKMDWAARQELKGKGLWHSSKMPYQNIINNSQNWIPEMLSESGASCDSGGCTD